MAALIPNGFAGIIVLLSLLQLADHSFRLIALTFAERKVLHSAHQHYKPRDTAKDTNCEQNSSEFVLALSRMTCPEAGWGPRCC